MGYEACRACGAPSTWDDIDGETIERPDTCIGYLPGVFNACCGHGDPDHAYLSFGSSKTDYVTITGHDALRIMIWMRKALGDESRPEWVFGSRGA